MGVSLAGRLMTTLGKVPGGARFLTHGGSNIIGQSLPGSIITTGLTTLATGNPFAGLAVGATDLAASSLLARGLASQGLNQFLAKRNLPLTEGKFHRSVDLNKVRTMRQVAKQPRVYHASGPQNLAMMAGSVGATLAIEPQFYPQQATQAQQLAQLKNVNDLSPTTAHGTMYQTQGIPMRFANLAY